MFSEQLVSERTRGILQEAERFRCSRRLRALRQARRLEHRAERRMVEARRRTAELRSAIQSADY
jgi:hypothetical protein